ncbi:MAG: thioredoxin-like domain-containing protein [Roseiflexaceae bacterium]|nr:thioredoxin-like domain-containing protein [Roseiflexaceae bacterium]
MTNLRYLLLLALVVSCSAAPPSPIQPPALLPTAQPAPSAAQALPTATSQPELPTELPTAQPTAGHRTGQDEGQGSYGEGGVDLYARPAPEFPDGLTWLNTERPLTMAELRGKVVLLDFWTYGCVNCLHNFPDLKKLEAEYPDELVVIGVHSAKFTNEADTENIRQIILRYGLDHAIVNDSKLTVWKTWDVRAWPTLVLVDAKGTMASLHVGEGVYRVFKPLIRLLVQEAEAHGTLDRTPIKRKLERDGRPATVLSFPGKVLADPNGARLFIADTNHHRIVIADPRTGDVLGVAGDGTRALRDGGFREAALASPQGMVLSADGRTLYVADTGNHAIRALDLEARTVKTLVGTGEQARIYPPEQGLAPNVALSSPWDLALNGVQLYIAMAGSHQIWVMNLAAGLVLPVAGSSNEGTADGPRAEADLAQPSGLASDGQGRLYFSDTESSAVRWLELAGRGQVKTLAGGGRSLFSFGDIDGIGAEARLQHPLGLTYTADGGGLLYITDTYNNKIKTINPATGEVKTMFGGTHGWRDGGDPLFYEPGGLSIVPATADRPSLLYVADTNNHAIRVIDLATREASTLVLKGIERFNATPDETAFQGTVVRLDPAQLAVGAGTLRLNVALPPGYKVNDLAPSAVRWRVGGQVVALPTDADRSLTGMHFPIDIPATFATGAGDLTADLTVIYCEANTPKLCLIEEVRLIAPVIVGDRGANTLDLRYEIALPR